MPFGVKKQKMTLVTYGITKMFPLKKNNVYIALLYTALEKKHTINIDKRRKTLRFSKSLVIVQKMRLLKIPVESPILQISEDVFF